MRKVSIGLFFITSIFTVVVFQNCSKANFSSTRISSGVVGGGRIVDQTNQYSHVVYDHAIQKEGADPAGINVQINLLDGRVTYYNTNGYDHAVLPNTHQACQIDENRFRNLNALLASSSICSVSSADLPEGMATCMAIAMPDISLINKSLGKEIHLNPVVCHNGTFLCNGDDIRFRSMLADLALHRPLDCNIAK